MSNDIIQDHRHWVMYLQTMVTGDEMKVTRYWDETEEHHIDLFTARKTEGILAATVGVMDVNQSNNPNTPVHTEILMDIRGQNEIINNILSTVGLYMIKNQWKAAPGIVFENMVEMYVPEVNVKHIVFIVPFQWKSGMGKVPAGNRTIYPLLAVSITDNEKNYIQSNGIDALGNLWAVNGCDVLNLERLGVV